LQTQDEATAVAVTVRHLLTHMAGWDGDLFRETGQGERALARYAALLEQQSQIVPLETHFSYNNAAFSLAGHLIEQVAEQPYETVLREQILTPLGMDEAFFDARDLVTHRFAVGHEDDQVARPWYLTRSAYPAGALCCHLRDLLKYGRFQLGDGTVNDNALLSAAGLAQCHAPQFPIWGKESMALAWFVDDSSGTRILSHGGATNGQIALLALVPEHALILAVLTNDSKGRVLSRKLLEWVMEHFLRAPLPQPEPIPCETADLRPYVGRFERDAAELELGILGGRLVGQYAFRKGFPDENAPPPPPPPPMTFLPTGEDEFMIGDGPMAESRVHAIRREDGAIGWLRLGLRLHRRVDDHLQEEA
jgi:CubicO group peptidase (beta-lactamase class C family)